MTTQLESAIRFYVEMLGLSLKTIEDDPIREGRQRAMLTDQDGREVLEIIEMQELVHPTIPGRGGLHHLGFQPAAAGVALAPLPPRRGGPPVPGRPGPPFRPRPGWACVGD